MLRGEGGGRGRGRGRGERERGEGEGKERGEGEERERKVRREKVGGEQILLALHLLFRWNGWSGVGHLSQTGDNGKGQET